MKCIYNIFIIKSVRYNNDTYSRSIHFFFSLIVIKAINLLNHSWICSWKQSVLRNEDKISRSKKHLEPTGRVILSGRQFKSIWQRYNLPAGSSVGTSGSSGSPSPSTAGSDCYKQLQSITNQHLKMSLHLKFQHL